MNDTARKCLFCGKDISDKRSDAKFCSPEHKRDHFRKRDTASVKTPVKDTPTPPIKSTKLEGAKLRDYVNGLLKAKGLNPAIKLASEIEPVQFVSSGIKEIDDLTGGFPRGRVSEIFGLKGVGKTSLMTQVLKNVPDYTIYYFDAEGALSPHYLQSQGVANDNLQVENEFILERVVENTEVLVQTNAYDLIVVDSIASLIPFAEIEGESGDAHMGLKARLMSQWMRKLGPFLYKTKTALVFINQQRESMNPYGPNKFTPGGHAVPYASSLRLELKSNKADRKENGHIVHVEVEKSKVCKPYQKTEFKLTY